jgi:hypothetical protein
MTKAKNPHWGSTLDDFLKEEGIHREVTTAAIKSVIAMDSLPNCADQLDPMI